MLTVTPLGLQAPAARRVRWRLHSASMIESLLTLAVIALLWPSFQRVASWETAVEQRFAVPGAVASAPSTPLRASACESDTLSPEGAPCGTPATDARATALTQARQTATELRKNAAMQALFAGAGWQWATAMLLGLACVKLSRTRVRPAVGAALAIAAWATAAWAARVPSPLGGGRVFELAREGHDPWSPPSRWVMALFGVALLLLVQAWLRPARSRVSAQTLSTRLGYAGFALACGLGWLLLLDLSAHAHWSNRYLALYHQGHAWLAMLVFSVMLFAREPLGRVAAWSFSVLGEAARRVASRLGTPLSWTLGALAAVALAAAIGLPLNHMRQLTSELGRVWVIVGAAWFFFLRGGPLAERLARAGPALGSVLRYVSPLLFVALVLLATMLITHDMGPLLIAGYGAGAFLAASVAMWWTQRHGRAAWGSLMAVLLFVAWVALTTWALFRLGSMEPVTAARLESLAAPLASGNDQLALVQWFQRAAPDKGFGLGSVPWCGYASVQGCNGVPAQIHSDYSFTALVGVFGALAAWAVSLGAAAWLHRLVRHHGRVTRGEPRLVVGAGRLGNDAQGFLSWVGVAWVVLTLCQLAVTVAGNMAVLPLTGVTFPFLSFGMTSLVVNMAFLALCINLSVPEASHG